MIPLLARSCSRPTMLGRTIPAIRPLSFTSYRPHPLSSLTARQSQLPPSSTLLTTTPSPSSTKTSKTSTTSGVTPHTTIVSELTDPLRPPSLTPGSTSTSRPELDILDRILPKWASGAKPYLLLTRIDKPIGSLLLFWPCAWSITMASTVHHLSPGVPAFYMALFGVGALVMRGAGCTVNDMWDVKFDKAVERTQNRPLARGDITQFQALTFLGGQLSLGLAVLTQLNWYSIVLGASSLGFVVMYPFMKRITYYPQIFFSLTFNWGAMLGWSAVAGVVDWSIVTPMYFGGIAWGIMYDLIYAHQDKKDDVLAGVKSMALRFPDNSRTVISTLSATFVSALTLTGHLAGLGPLYYLISCGGAAAHLAWQCITVDFDNRADCWRKFVSNGYLGGLIWSGIAANYVSEVVVPGLY